MTVWTIVWILYLLVTFVFIVSVYQVKKMHKENYRRKLQANTVSRFIIIYIMPFFWPIIIPLGLYMGRRK